MKRSASAVWEGGLKSGKGQVSTERGVLKNTPYNFSGRFEEGTTGTNPEELIAAAHAGCFSMAFSGQLEKVGITPQRIETNAQLRMEKIDDKMTVTGVHLATVVTAPGADQAKFKEAAENAKKGCPISRLLSNIEITMDAKLA
ncbi:MAG TPA: OsmC family protein [Candidatus Thermoplasmatota archaeon]|nr:OsmC family protein [Candidatus Thermoplasmatota archaeon]